MKSALILSGEHNVMISNISGELKTKNFQNETV